MCTYGKVTINSDKSTEAGIFCSFAIKIKPHHDFTMYPRTQIEIVQFTRFYSNQFSLPQTHDPTAPGYVLAKRSDGGFINTVVRRVPDVLHRHGAGYHVIQLRVGENPLEKDGWIEVIYGYKGAGGPGTKCPPLAKSYSFPVFISQRHVLGGKRFKDDELISFDSLFVNNSNVSTNLVKEKAAFDPKIKVTGGRAEKLKILVSPRDGKKAVVTVNALDIFGNISPFADGIVSIGQYGNITLEKGFGRTEIMIEAEGVQRLTGSSPELNLSCVSNPFKMGQRLAWGEIHSHSGISDGLGTDRENYNSAIQSGLDFGALSDHDTLMEKDPSLWEKTIENAVEYHNEPDFITLLGYEALAYKDSSIAGHINIYYPGLSGEMTARPEIGDIPALCRKHNAVSIPHHTMYGGPFFDQMGLKVEHMDPDDFTADLMPVIEIYSTHGCSETEGCEDSVLGVNAERSVNAALKRGFRWGFIGGSDNHESLLGHNLRVDRLPRTVNNEHMQFRHGRTAAYVDSYSRTGVFDAIRRRSVYATTGDRILLTFMVNGTRMGGETPHTGTGNEIHLEISGTSTIEKIEIIKNGEIIHSRYPDVLDCGIVFIDETEAGPGTYYYIKAVQKDGGMAWSSPVWIV